MKRILLFLLIFSGSHALWAQKAVNQKNQAALQEGKKLYRLEMASWHGSDLFMERLKDKSSLLGGYLAYADGPLTKCIFFTRADQPTTLAIISFDSTFNPQAAQVEVAERALSAQEQDLFSIRKTALTKINTDTIFKNYQNATLNLIPLIDASGKRVYVVTGPKVHGTVLLGNDYLLTFVKDNSLASVKKLHQNLIPIPTASQDKDPGKKIMATMHTHLEDTGEHLTATDVCTLLLYQKFTTWKQHYVLSKNHISIWDCNTNQLTTLTKAAWEKLNAQQTSRKESKTD